MLISLFQFFFVVVFLYSTYTENCGTIFIENILRIVFFRDFALFFRPLFDPQVYHGKKDPVGIFPGESNQILLSCI